jgi:hypothetical protein
MALSISLSLNCRFNGSINTNVFKIVKIINIIQNACVNSDFDIILQFYYQIIYAYAFNV